MRVGAMAAVVFLASACASGQLPSSTPLSQLAGGTISGSSYSNDALGVVFHFPRGWTGNLDAGHAAIFGKDPNGPANKCTRILLRYESSHKVEGWFSAWGILFAIDPVCLGAGPFPTSADTKDAAEINAFAQKIFELYHPSPFLPEGGVDLYYKRAQPTYGPVFVYLEGKGSRDVDESDPSIKRTPVPVTTLFALTEVPGLWVAWAQLADDRSQAELERGSGIELKRK